MVKLVVPAADNARMRSSVFMLGLVAIATLMVVKEELSEPLLYRTLRGQSANNTTDIFIPSSLDLARQRSLSLNLGGGNCKWQPPQYDVPDDIDFHKTIIAGFPSGDKRMIFAQVEALTGWPAKDEWDFEYLGPSNHPFIKANYPHHEGIWGWDDVADQVVLMIRNIRQSMVEYHDIAWDIGYAKSWDEANLYLDQLYNERPPVEDFLIWRDIRVMEEIHWYGWLIDYWMEGGIMRDVYTHKLTTVKHWHMLMMPSKYTMDELDYDTIVGADTVIKHPKYDPHCINNEISYGCEPVAVISAEKLIDYTEGPPETTKIANVLLNDDRTGKYVIGQEAWDCIWKELIQDHKGHKTVYDRPGSDDIGYDFSTEMLAEMIDELNRLIAKYGSPKWNDKSTANRIVSLLTEHRALLQIELNEVTAGMRRLDETDFLGPKERQRRRNLKENNGKPENVDAVENEQKDFSDYFNTLREKLLDKKRREMRQIARGQVEVNMGNVTP